jgi:hypothetical protein
MMSCSWRFESVSRLLPAWANSTHLWRPDEAGERAAFCVLFPATRGSRHRWSCHNCVQTYMRSLVSDSIALH